MINNKIDYGKVFGKTITVTITHKIGDNCETRPNSKYRLNCGYSHNTVIDKKIKEIFYVIGVGKPIEEFTGKIIAVMHRKDSRIFVVTKEGREYYSPEIACKINYTHRCKSNDFICRYEKSCGAVPYYIDDNGEVFYILIENRSGNIGFPKGHMELSENELDTAKRELQEEINVHSEINSDFREINTYVVKGYATKTVVLYIVNVNKKNLLSVKSRYGEIINLFKCSYEKSLSLLTYKADKEILKKAHQYITKEIEK